MKSKRIAAFAAACMAGMLAVSAAGGLNPKNGDLNLRAEARFRHETAYSYLDLTIANNSKFAACIGDSSFDRLGSHIAIWDSIGRRLSPHQVGSPQIVDMHGFNDGDSYDFLFPGKSVHAEIPLTNFTLLPGTFRFRVVMFYYVCRNVLGLESGTPSADLNMSSVEMLGSFHVP
jgi:hypothetical protein